MASQCHPIEHPDDRKAEKEQLRVLRRLCETGAFLVLSEGLEKAAIMRQTKTEEPTRSGVADTDVAAALVLKDWIECTKRGRIACYKVTSAGRAALRRAITSSSAAPGFGEAASVFSEQHKDWGERVIPEPGTDRPRKMRVNLRESPLLSLGRKKGKDGQPFLTPQLLAAGERLREDFELAQLGPRVAQNWERFLTAGNRGSFGSTDGGSSEAQRRLSAALTALGPGLSDIAMRCCCFLEGLEAAEKRMGWSARSGKIVLRISLQRLCVHYEDEGESQMRKIG